ncbi:MAG: zinc-binding alcohol dehydrogenase [Lentisphaerae bacterium]|nr:zinc-binding alcohol dehydrogenase [Lentisphaerota bacterium]
MQIEACIITAPFKAHLGRVTAEDPGPESVVIRTEYSVISNGTEAHVQRGSFPDTPYVYPFVIGYQAAGCVTAVGDRVKDIKVGDRVFTTTNQVTGITNALGGVHARTIVAKAADVLKTPAEVGALDAAGLVVAQVGYNGGYRLPLEYGPRALVIGDGLIGQCAAQAAVARGFEVALAGHYPDRLALARKLTPSLCTINTAEEDLGQKLKSYFGAPLDLALDSVGTQATLEMCYRNLKRWGVLVVQGWQGGNQTLSAHQGLFKELTVLFRAGYTRERLLATLDLMRQGKMRIAPLITHRFPPERLGEAYALLNTTRAAYLGIAIEWQ